MHFARACRASAPFATLALSVAGHALAGGMDEPSGALTLPQAIAATLARNPELQLAAYGLRAADARVTQAGLRPNPELGLDLENFAGSGALSGTDALETTLSLSQVIELGGQRARRVDVARRVRDTLDIERTARQLDVLAEVTRRFIRVVADQEQAALARQAADLSDTTLAAITTRVSAARSPEAEGSRAGIAATRARIERQRAELTLQGSRRQLAAMWGSTEAGFETAQADLYALSPVEDFQTLVERLKRNPDFLRFAAESRLRDAETRLAQAQAKPNLLVGMGLRRLEESGDTALVAEFSLPLPVSDRRRGAIREARIRRDQVEAEEQSAFIRAQATLFELYQQLLQSRWAAAALRTDALTQAQDALAQIDSGYARGRFSYLELAAAQQELIDVQRAAITAAAEYHQMKAEIERLTGEPLAADPL